MGGIKDGADVTCYTESANTGMYKGGSDSDITIYCFTQDNVYNNIFKGGNNDGSSINCYEEDLTPTFNPFSGGVDDGFSLNCYEESFGFGYNLFYGGSDDGYNALCFNQQNGNLQKLFYGGVEDGVTVLCHIQSNLNTDLLFKGGIDDGFNYYCFEQDYNNMLFLGGDNDGVSIDCYEQNLTPPFTHFTGGFSNGQYENCFSQTPYLVTLPIELITFEAYQTGTTEVELFWITASEINNDYFIIERSADGWEWEDLMQTNGAGNSNEIIEYLEYDIEPLSGVNFYRLKQVDFDGNYTYSIVRRVVLNDDKLTNNDFLLYPNPTNGLINLQFTNFNSDLINISIVDIQGKNVLNMNIELNNGTGLFSFQEGYKLATGQYIVIVSNENIYQQQKLIVK